MKLKLETKGFVKDIEIDGGAVMNSLIVTYIKMMLLCRKRLVTRAFKNCLLKLMTIGFLRLNG